MDLHEEDMEIERTESSHSSSIIFTDEEFAARQALLKNDSEDDVPVEAASSSKSCGTQTFEGYDPVASQRSKKTLKEIIQEKKRQQSIEQIKEGEWCFDPYKKSYDLKKVSRKPTMYCYVPSSKHICRWDPDYPECPARAFSVDVLARCLTDMTYLSSENIVKISPLDLVKLVHNSEYIKKIRWLCDESSEAAASTFDSVYATKDSLECAASAARHVLSIGRLIMTKSVQNGFANVRPPGHHAGLTDPNGYCLFNNVAITAKYLLKEKLADKILIVDFDVHHGQGTQDIFYETNKVLYFSIHRYEFGTFWPNLQRGNFNYVGSGKGAGYNINVPLNDTGLSDYDYLFITISILLPVAYEGRMNVTPALYAHLTTLLGGLAGGKILAVLEGGYFEPSLAEGALRTISALKNFSCPPLEYHKHLNSSVIDSINNVKVALRPYWKCFNQVEPIASVKDVLNYDRYNQHVAVIKYVGKVDNPPFPTQGAFPTKPRLEQESDKYKVQHLASVYNSTPTTKVGFDNKINANTKVGLVVNDVAHLHDPPSDARSQEVQQRLVEIRQKLSEFDVSRNINMEVYSQTEVKEDTKKDFVLISVAEFIAKVHSKEYLSNLEKSSCEQKPDLYSMEHTSLVCKVSCAALCRITACVVQGKYTHGVALVRPPGHHAKNDEGAGFCHINHVVVAAEYALDRFKHQRILILDFDIHHGDGTQKLTYHRNDIMYISVHRFDEGKFFPHNGQGDFRNIGEGCNAGFNVNVPFDHVKMGNFDYLMTWMKVILPLAYSYNPSLIFISAGFDAGINDTLGHYEVHPELFGHLVNLVKPVAPVILTLEGGYHLETTSLSMVNCIKALVGDPLPMPDLGDISKEAAASMFNTISVTKQYWPMMQVNKILDPVIRDAQDIEQQINEMEKINLTLGQ